MWVTYLNGDDPDGEHEFFWGQSVSFLVERDRTFDQQTARETSPKSARSSDRDGTHTRSRRQASESGGERCVPRDAANCLARRLTPQREDLSGLTSLFNPFGESPSGDGLLQKAASESGGKQATRRRLKESCKTMSPSSPEATQSPLNPRTQWMREDDPRTEEQADADWRLVTESIFGANTRAAPKVVGEKDWCDERFSQRNF